MATKTTPKIRPLGDRILVKRIDESEQVQGGIIIPDTAKEKPTRAEIVAVGPGKKKNDGSVIPMDVTVGETILLSKYAGTEVKLDGDDYLILREDDVLGVIQG